MKRTPLVFCLALAGTIPVPAAAQRIVPRAWPAPVHADWPAGPQRDRAPAVVAPLPADSGTARTGQWRLGGGLGALVGGAAGAAFGVVVCGMSDSPNAGCGLLVLGSVAFGGVTGFVLGALIGSHFPARDP